jgi:DNA-binding response OmpR family regulator
MSPPRRIIVIDDEKDIRDLLSQAICPPEFECHVSRTAGAALVRMHDIRPTSSCATS